MSAFYNENDPGAAAWLGELVKGGHVADGRIDTRSIADLRATDVSGHAQVHLFAGIGGWSHALRLAGWPDDEPAWTGSCPCQPFSNAGRRRGEADERHLWPHFARLIGECRPAVVFGEQVTSPAGRAWLATVRADLEAMGYRVGAADLCAAGAGAPHARQRIFFMAHALRRGRGPLIGRLRTRQLDTEWGGGAGGVADHDQAGCSRLAPARLHAPGPSGLDPDGRGAVGGMADPECGAPERRRFAVGGTPAGTESPGDQRERLRPDAGDGGHPGELEHAQRAGLERLGGNGDDRDESGRLAAGADGPVAATGFWGECEWVYCRPDDSHPAGCWRPVEPGAFPLAHGLSARMVRLRGYGNAINPELAAQFILAGREAIEEAAE